MILKPLYFIIFFFSIFFATPQHSWAFFTPEVIEIVQKGSFDVEKNTLIEDVLDDYALCKRGEWDTYTTEKKENIVTYQCEYAVDQAIKTQLKILQVTDVNIQNEVISELNDKDFSLNVLFAFSVNEKKKTFALQSIEYVFGNEKLGTTAAQSKAQVKKILENKPLTLQIPRTAHNAFAALSYALEKVILNSEKNFSYAAPFYEDIGFAYTIKHAPLLTATLSDFQFDDETMRIKATANLSIEAAGKKVDVEKEKGYFIKYFKAALANSPIVLQREEVEVFLRKNPDNITNFTFESIDKTFSISFVKNNSLPLVQKAIKVSYKGNINQEVKDFIQKNAKIAATPQGISNELLGNYVYDADGMKGSVRIRQYESEQSAVHVALNTVNVQALHLCEYEGICTLTDGKYVCPIKDAPEGMESFFEIVPSEFGFNIPQNPSLLCGVRGFMSGDYSRCIEQTSGPLTMIVVPMEIIHEDETFIVRFTDNGAESLEFITQKQAEFLETMIGKNVLVHYNQSQVWNTQKNFCNRSREIISVEDATKPEAKLLGGYSHMDDKLKGYAFIEPDFSAKSAFTIHLNNYSMDLEKNCQFAGECYAEGSAFICKTFDKEQNTDEYFELIPSGQGFLVIDNPTNTCAYTGFMPGNYEKCVNKIFSNSSVFGKLIAVDESDFMYTHVIIRSDGIEVDMRIGIDQIALAKSLLNKDVFVSFVDEQYWGEHDRTCVREKKVTRIQTVSTIKESLMGNYVHVAEGISGSAIIGEVENVKDAFFLTLKNLGLHSGASCAFSGVCRPAKNGFLCQSLGNPNDAKKTVTVIPSDDGFNIALDITTQCKIRSLPAGNYTKCVKKTLGASTVTGLLTKVNEMDSSKAHVTIMVNAMPKVIDLPVNSADFKQQLADVKSFLNQNVTVSYTEDQDWNEKDKLCKYTRTFTAIKAVKLQQKP